jgi:hypothetical protein
MVLRSFAHLHPLSSHLTGRTLALRLDHLSCQRTLQAERAPRSVRWEVQDRQPAEISWLSVMKARFEYPQTLRHTGGQTGQRYGLGLLADTWSVGHSRSSILRMARTVMAFHV